MLTGSPPPISRRSTYIETLELIDDDTGDLIDLTGAAVSVEIRFNRTVGDDYGWLGRRADLVASLDDGRVAVPELGVIQWRFEAGAFDRIGPGSASLSVLIQRDGDTDKVADLILPFED